MKNQYKKRCFKCLGCGKEVTLRRSIYNLKYCSFECFSHSEHPQSKTGKYIACDFCGELVYKKKYCLEKHKNYFCSLKCSNNYQGRNKLRFICKICGVEFKWSPSRIKEHNPIYCSIKCRNMDVDWVKNASIKANYVQQYKKGLNKLELLGREILNNLNVKFEEQVLMFNKFLVDVYIDQYSLIIQWDGDYWHGHPKYSELSDRQVRRKKLDYSQNRYFEKCGYKVLRFWETDIKKEVEEKSDYIRRTIQEITG